MIFLQLASSKMLIFEVHMSSFFRNFVNFVKLIHIELSDKRSQMFMPEEMW